jgi:hypothetical protein
VFEVWWTITEEMNMKKFLPVLFLIFSSFVHSETYTCTTELSNFGQQGKVETSIYTRSGKVFIGNTNYRKNFPSSIIHENSSDIVLSEVLEGVNKTSVLITLISKKNLKYRQEFIDFNVSKNDRQPQLIGECLVN